MKGASKGLSLLALSGVLFGLPTRAQAGADAVPSGFTTPIPSELLTPDQVHTTVGTCLLYTSPSPRDVEESRMPSYA